MNKPLKPLAQKWVDELRAGRISQLSPGRLTNMEGTSMCCLGVLCEVAGLPRKGDFFTDNGEKLTHFAPEHLLVEAGMSGATQPLIRMNDTECKTFAQIADFIEATAERG